MKNKILEKLKNNKKIIIFSMLILIIAIIFFIILLKADARNYQEIELSQLSELNNGVEPDILIDNKDNLPVAIMGAYTLEKVKNSEEAIQSLACLKKIYGIQNPQDEFFVYNENEFGDEKIYRLGQKYNGYKVYRKQLIITTDLKGNVKSISGDYDKIENVNTEVKISEEDAEKIVNEKYENISQPTSTGLLIYNLDVETPHIAYNIYGFNEEESLSIFIDAITGDILGDEIASFNIQGTGETHSGETATFNIKLENNKYQLIDESRNIKIINKINNYFITQAYTTVESYTTNFDNKEAVTLMNNMSKVYDFYNQKLGLKSFNGNGNMVLAEINDKDTNNASFARNIYITFNESNNMFFRFGAGDGINYKSFTNGIDAIAHEYTHAYIYCANGGFKKGEIDEAFADVVGNITENYLREKGEIKYFTENENLTFSEDENWTIGEDIIIGKQGFRSMANPEDYDNPSKYMGEYYTNEINSSNRSKVIHSNCCVLDNVAYTMWKNGLTTDEILYLFMLTPQKVASTAGYAEISHMMISLAKQNFPDKADYVKSAFELANIAIIDNTTSIKDVIDKDYNGENDNNEDTWKKLYKKFVLTNDFIDDNVVNEPELLIMDLDFNYVPELVYNTGIKTETGDTIYQIYAVENSEVKQKESSLALEKIELIYDKISKEYFWGYKCTDNEGTYERGVIRGLGKNTTFQFTNNNNNEFSERYVHMVDWKEISQNVVNFNNNYTREQRKESIERAIENYISNTQITKNYPYTFTDASVPSNEQSTNNTTTGQNNTSTNTSNTPNYSQNEEWIEIYNKNQYLNILYTADVKDEKLLVLDLNHDGVPEIITPSTYYYIKDNKVYSSNRSSSFFGNSDEIQIKIFNGTNQYFYFYQGDVNTYSLLESYGFYDPFEDFFITFSRRKNHGSSTDRCYFVSGNIIKNSALNGGYTGEAEYEKEQSKYTKYQTDNVKSMTVTKKWTLKEAYEQYRQVEKFLY